CNPAPVDGFFETNVELGQKVSGGTILGTVISIEDDSLHPMISSHAGIVLMLRTFSRVRAGESVGVVLESV
ncbi:MAG: hypothetical protein KDB01_26465, partial [Planctomycetaceae bacterium]|nr:hypothetical protein [Planctomycetaceae bacterium]